MHLPWPSIDRGSPLERRPPLSPGGEGGQGQACKGREGEASGVQRRFIRLQLPGEEMAISVDVDGAVYLVVAVVVVVVAVSTLEITLTLYIQQYFPSPNK